MKSLRVICAALLCLAASWGSGPARAEDAPIFLHPVVWEGYQKYVGLKFPGAFAVSRDGSNYGYSYCSERRCRFNTDKKTALGACAESAGDDCLIFAIKRDIQVPYEVIGLTAAE